MLFGALRGCVMGSTDSGATEFSVGSIVWVRRRNGSWWPGKIVGPEELSASHLTSPRSGTPVKLLGREDASVYVSILSSLSLISLINLVKKHFLKLCDSALFEKIAKY